MSDEKSEHPWNTSAQKPKEQSLAEIIQKIRADSPSSPGRVNLRKLLIERTMAKHGFTEEQALALILAFGGT